MRSNTRKQTGRKRQIKMHEVHKIKLTDLSLEIFLKTTFFELMLVADQSRQLPEKDATSHSSSFLWIFGFQPQFFFPTLPTEHS